MEKKITSAVSFGVVLGLIMVVCSVILYFSGLYLKSWSQYIGLAIMVLGIIWGIMNYSKERDANVTFGNLFSLGFKISAVVLCITLAYTVLSNFIFPDAKEKIIEMAKEQAMAKPGADADQVEKGMNMFADHYTLFIVIGLIFWLLIVGVIASLIGAAIAKKNPHPDFEK